ncbi:MAG: GNAT family N-acetyltransferase, partial [Asticcacaulis sp.]
MSDLFAPDEQALRALNNAFAEQTSFLDEAGWARLTAAARFAFMAPDALLLAFDQDGDYDSPNFLWFRDRYERFGDRAVP